MRKRPSGSLAYIAKGIESGELIDAFKEAGIFIFDESVETDEGSYSLGYSIDMGITPDASREEQIYMWVKEYDTIELGCCYSYYNYAFLSRECPYFNEYYNDSEGVEMKSYAQYAEDMYKLIDDFLKKVKEEEPKAFERYKAELDDKVKSELTGAKSDTVTVKVDNRFDGFRCDLDRLFEMWKPECIADRKKDILKLGVKVGDIKIEDAGDNAKVVVFKDIHKMPRPEKRVVKCLDNKTDFLVQCDAISKIEDYVTMFGYEIITVDLKSLDDLGGMPVSETSDEGLPSNDNHVSWTYLMADNPDKNYLVVFNVDNADTNLVNALKHVVETHAIEGHVYDNMLVCIHCKDMEWLKTSALFSLLLKISFG